MIKKEKSHVRDENRKDPVHSGYFYSSELPYSSNISFLPQNVAGVGVLLTWQPGIGDRSVTTLPRKLMLKTGATFHRQRERSSSTGSGLNISAAPGSTELLTAAQAARDREPKSCATRWTPYSHQTIVLSDLLKQQSRLQVQRISTDKVYLRFGQREQIRTSIG